VSRWPIARHHPARLGKQRVNIRERAYATFNRLFQPLRCVGLRKNDRCLYARKQVLTSMLCFSRQSGNSLLASLLLSNISSVLD
jgi:hypothetical protein